MSMGLGVAEREGVRLRALILLLPFLFLFSSRGEILGSPSGAVFSFFTTDLQADLIL